LLSKSPFTNDSINDLYLNICGSQMFNTNCPDPIELLDSLDSDSFNMDNFIMNDGLGNNSTIQHSTQTNYYQSQPNAYGNSIINPMTINQTQSKLVTTQNLGSSTNNSFNQSNDQSIVLQQSLNNNSNNSNHINNNNNNYQASSNPPQSSSVLNSSLCNESIKQERPTCFNDLLLSSTSANIILTQHNQSIDRNSQLNSNHHHPNQITNNNYTPNYSNLDLIQDNSNRCTDIVACSSDDLNDSLNHPQQINTPHHHTNSNITHFTNSYPLNPTHLSLMPYSTYDNHQIDLTFSCNGGDSADSNSSNSECSAALMLDPTDYDTDDIEDDLDLLEDIIEEEFDDSPFSHHQKDHHHNNNYARSNCRSIANSIESSSDVEMSMSSPISDSLINDHSYGASSNYEKTYDKVATSYRKHHSVSTGSSNSSHRNSSSTLIHHNNRISKRRSLPSMNQNDTTSSSRRTVQRHSGTSLLMKEKQMKMKKVMDTDRRKEHNESERMRRDVLKNAFSNLRNRCPKLSNSAKKSSRIQILNEATNFIKQINDKHAALKYARDQEKQRNEDLKARLLSLGGC